jgi:hypothetical protein
VKSILRRRPSPALVIALIALFISLSGVAYGVATGSIDSREIKQNTIRTGDLRNNEIRTRDMRNNEVRGIDIRNSTVQGREVALNTLTGDDINESRLGKVPSATSADTAAAAASAQNAATVGGMSVQKIFAKVPSSSTGGTILETDYFVLAGSCIAGDAEMLLFGKSGVQANATAHSITPSGPPTGTPTFMSSNNLSAAQLDLLGQGPEGTSSITVSTTDGRVSTIMIGAQDAPAFQGENVCAFDGTVTSG